MHLQLYMRQMSVLQGVRDAAHCRGSPHGIARPGRFASESLACDGGARHGRLVEAGYGARGGDVPAEALLTLGDPTPVLTDAWPSLRDQDAAGLRRLLWLIDQCHRDSSKVIDSVTAEPIAALLLNEERPWEAGQVVADFLREWLLALIIGDTPVGQRSRKRRACTDGP